MKKYTDEQRSADYRFVFGSAEGRRVYEDILAKGGVFRPCETPDAILAARAEGARHLALHIASFVKFDASFFRPPAQGDDAE